MNIAEIAANKITSQPLHGLARMQTDSPESAAIIIANLFNCIPSKRGNPATALEVAMQF